MTSFIWIRNHLFIKFRLSKLSVFKIQQLFWSYIGKKQEACSRKRILLTCFYLLINDIFVGLFINYKARGPPAY